MHTPCFEPLQALLIRTGDPEQFAHFNPSLHQLRWVKGEALEDKVDLGFSGSKLLERLLKVPGEVVSREELIAYAWPERVVGQGSLNQQIYTLRQILNDEKDREIIQTLPRRGYLFNPQFLVERTLPEEPAHAESLSTEPVTERAQALGPRQRFSPRNALSIGLFSLIVLGTCAWQWNPPLKVGSLQVTLLGTDQERLFTQLQPLLLRIAQLTDTPQQVAISQAAGLYQLHCIQGQRNRTLAVHPSQLAALSDQHLLECLQ